MATQHQTGILVSVWHPTACPGKPGSPQLGMFEEDCHRQLFVSIHGILLGIYRTYNRRGKIQNIHCLFFLINFKIYYTMMLHWKDGSLNLFKMYTRALTLSFSSSGRLSNFVSLKERWSGCLAAGNAMFGSTGCSLIKWQGWPKIQFDTFQLVIQCCCWFSINPLENLGIWYLYLCFLYLNPVLLSL